MHVPAKVLTRLRRVETAAKRLEKMGLIYDYGGGRFGGHIVEPIARRRWTDCSGLPCYLLPVGGISLKDGSGSTWSLASEGEDGVSDFLTLFIKNTPGDEHVIIRLRERPKPWHNKPRHRWVQCGGSDNPSAGGGPSYFIPGREMGLSAQQRIAEFPIRRNFDRQLRGLA